MPATRQFEGYRRPCLPSASPPPNKNVVRENNKVIENKEITFKLGPKEEVHVIQIKGLEESLVAKNNSLCKVSHPVLEIQSTTDQRH